MSAENPTPIHAPGDATGFIPAADNKGKPITVIGTKSIRASFDATCLQQALNARSAPGVTDLVDRRWRKLTPARVYRRGVRVECDVGCRKSSSHVNA